MDKPSTEAGSGFPATSDQNRAENRKMRRVATASFMGTMIEGYDFVIYGTAAALVFPHIFFPALGESAGTIASLATFGAAFVARPLGSIVFGHLGDRLGRKNTLVATLLLMGIGTFLMGILPSAAQIGVAAPVILVILRIVQGISVGGEWAGATLFVSEHAPKEKRGLWGIAPQLGATVPNILGSATFLLTSALMSQDEFVSYGWRIPFLASGLLVIVGLYLRLKVEETPVFKKEHDRGSSRVPFVEAFKKQPGAILRGAGAILMVFSFAYFSSTYLISYASHTLKLSSTTILVIGILSGAAYSLGVPVSAILSDRIGRKKVIGGANIIAAVWALAIFAILDLGTVTAFAVTACVTFFIAGLAYGPIGAFLPEQFHTRYRYTATGFAYNLAGVVGGGLGPVIAAGLTQSIGGFAFGVYVSVLCLIAAACTFSLRETSNTELDWTEEAVLKKHKVVSGH
ncbi:MFS transporter [Arthrobacter sp. NPDC056493]|uniref:MFS transporter n=1 Tax=Arthrobacter sp. NPDC056493 TaxID=3345839 RepID=UPI0036724536